MCGLCGAIDADHHWTGGAVGASGPSPHLWRQERLRLAALASEFLAPTRIKVEDFGGISFIVRSATGATEVVAALPEVWRAAERLGGHPVDPLGKSFLREDGS